MELDILKLDRIFTKILLAYSLRIIFKNYFKVATCNDPTLWFANLVQGETFRRKVLETERQFDYEFYTLETGLIIEAYIQELRIPIKTVFGGKSSKQSDPTSRFCQSFTDTVSRLYISEVPLQRFDFECSNRIDESKDDTICTCGGSDFNSDSTFITCLRCGLRSHSVYTNTIIEKIPSDKRNHFINCFDNYQGKSKSCIPDSVFTAIEEKLAKYNLVDYSSSLRTDKFARVTKEHVKLILKDTGLHKDYGDAVNRIYQRLTGNQPPDVEHLRYKVVQDFDTFNQIYIKHYPNMAKKPFNYQHLLFQFLCRHGYPCNRADFRFLKTAERKAQHEHIYRHMFDKLGWNYTPIF